MYNPVVGRWLSPDPLGVANSNSEIVYSHEYVQRRILEQIEAPSPLNTNANLYAYASSNPVNMFDPSGLQCHISWRLTVRIEHQVWIPMTGVFKKDTHCKRLKKIMNEKMVTEKQPFMFSKDELNTYASDDWWVLGRGVYEIQNTFSCKDTTCLVECFALTFEINVKGFDVDGGANLTYKIPDEKFPNAPFHRCAGRNLVKKFSIPKKDETVGDGDDVVCIACLCCPPLKPPAKPPAKIKAGDFERFICLNDPIANSLENV